MKSEDNFYWFGVALMAYSCRNYPYSEYLYLIAGLASVGLYHWIKRGKE